MRLETVRYICCPSCSAQEMRLHTIKASEPTQIETGVVYCPAGHWFPIERGVLELLPPALAYEKDRATFWEQHSADLSNLKLSAFIPMSEITDSHKDEILHQQEHFDWYASNDAQSYDEYSRMPFWCAVDAWTFQRWSRLVSSSDLVLDVGCAQGRASLQLADRSPSVIGIDISKNLVTRAYQNFQQAGFHGAYDFIVADGSNPPFKPATFDCVLIYGVLHHLPAPQETCQRVAKLLKDGGLFLSSENNKSSFRGLFDLLMKLQKIWHEEAGAQPLLSYKEVKKWFQSTGITLRTFTIVFLPPHLVNMLPRRMGAALLRLTDTILGALPFFRKNGGLLIIEGRKSATRGAVV